MARSVYLALFGLLGCGAVTTTTAASDGGTDGALETSPPGCPSSMPEYGDPCALPEGTECPYDASHEKCGYAKCVGGKFETPFPGVRGCPLPPGPNPCTQTYDKKCTTDADCAFGVHQTSCCGDTVAVGYEKSQAVAFAAAEIICKRTFPGCGCASRGLATDEGTPDGGYLTPDRVKVTCVANACHTSPK